MQPPAPLPSPSAARGATITRVSRIPPITDLSLLSATLTTPRPSSAPPLSLSPTPPPRTLPSIPLPFSSTLGPPSISSPFTPSFDPLPSPRRIPPLSPIHNASIASTGSLSTRRLPPLSATSSIPPLDATLTPASPSLRLQPHPFGVTSSSIVPPLSSIPPPPSYPLPTPFLPALLPAPFPTLPSSPLSSTTASVAVPDIASFLVSCGGAAYIPSFYQTGCTDLRLILTSPPDQWPRMLDAVMADMQVRLDRGEVTAADLSPHHRDAIAQALQRERFHFLPFLASPTSDVAKPAPSTSPASRPPRPTPTAAVPSHLHFEHFCHICRHWLCCFSIGAALLLLTGIFFVLYERLHSSSASTPSVTPALTGFEAVCGFGLALGGLCWLVAATCWLRWPEHRRCGGHGGCGGCGPAEGVTCCAGVECEACTRCEEEWDDRDWCRGDGPPAKWPTCPSCPSCPTFSRPACCLPSTKPSPCPSCAHLTLPSCCERDPASPSCLSRLAAFCTSCCAALSMCVTSCCAAVSSSCAMIQWPACGCGLTACLKECCEGCGEQLHCGCCEGCTAGCSHCCEGGGPSCQMPTASCCSGGSGDGCAQLTTACRTSLCYKVLCCQCKIQLQ